MQLQILASRKHPKKSNDAVLINKNLCSDFQRIIGQYLFQGTIIKAVDIKAIFSFYSENPNAPFSFLSFVHRYD